jgi:hypothetical protein
MLYLPPGQESLLQPRNLVVPTPSMPYGRLYTHYACHSSCGMPIDEKELYHAMDEARQSYVHWKQLQQQLVEAMQK